MLPWYLKHPDPITMYMDNPYTVLDLETTNKDHGSPLVRENRIILSCAKYYNGRIIEVAGAAGAVTTPGILVAHHAKFELMWLNREGVDTKHLLIWDTMLAEYVIAGNRRRPLDLDSVARRYGLPGKDPFIDALMKGGVCPSEMPRELLAARCRRDVETTEQIFLKQRAYMLEQGLLPTMLTRCIFTPVLAGIEAEGMYVDSNAVQTEQTRVQRELLQVEWDLAAITGGINLRSPKQMAEFLYDKLGFKELTDRRGNPRRTPSGARLTDSGTLDALVATTSEQRRFISLRQKFGDLNARLTKTLEFLGAVVDGHGSHFYGTFNQTRTQTHRLSSSGRKITIKDADGKEIERGIQFQNLPVEYKKLFTTRDPKFKMVEIDGAQLEFRVAAFLGQDSTAVTDILTGHDVHRYTASILYGIPPDKVTKEQRNNAKPDTFKPLYGGQSGTQRQIAYYEWFRNRYCKIETEQKKWVHTVLRDKELTTATGLTFYWPDTEMQSSGYITNTASIYNYPVQSLATAEIIPISVTYLYWHSLPLKVRMVNTVHDSAVLEVHEDYLEAVASVARMAFFEDTYNYLERVYNIKFNVPLGIGFTVGTHWGEGTEQKFSRPNPRVETLS